MFVIVKAVSLVYLLVVAHYKAWVCGRSLAGIAGSNPVGGMDVCLLEVCSTD
jgi:hypothetical protein